MWGRRSIGKARTGKESKSESIAGKVARGPMRVGENLNVEDVGPGLEVQAVHH